MRSRRSFASSVEACLAVRLAALLFGAWLAASGFVPATALAADDLVHIEVEAERAADGKPIDMEFHEIERTPEISRARVLTGAGGSASAASIFVLRGFCAVAESRGAKFFHPRPLLAGEAAEAIHTAEFADERAAVTPARLPAAAASAADAAAGGTVSVVVGPADRAAADGVFSIDDCRLAGFVR